MEQRAVVIEGGPQGRLGGEYSPQGYAAAVPGGARSALTGEQKGAPEGATRREQFEARSAEICRAVPGELRSNLTGEDERVEKQLEKSGMLAVNAAHGMRIESTQDYEQAGKFLLEIKNRAKKIKDYWAPTKAAAKAAHQAIVDREKEMLLPLTEAERIIKASMTSYQAAVEKARREAEAAAKKRQREEADRLLEQALAAHDSGDDHGAAIGMAMAEMVEEMQPVPVVDAPKATGTSVSKIWKARVIDAAAVPAYSDTGVELRSINMATLNSIARMTRGTAKIPGVEFYEDLSIRARA